jgi:hypothetical protein
MNTGSAVRSSALVAVGLAVGFAVATARNRGTPEIAKPAAFSAQTPPSMSTAEPPVKGADVRAAYINALAQAATARPGEAEHVPSDDPQVNDPSPEDYVRIARAEPTDATWAAEQTAKLDAELILASEHLDFRYQNLTCRTKQCTVDLEWRSLAAARAAFKTGFMNEFQQTKCMQRLLLPDSARDDAPARGTLILTCDRPKVDEPGAVSARQIAAGL